MNEPMLASEKRLLEQVALPGMVMTSPRRTISGPAGSPRRTMTGFEGHEDGVHEVNLLSNCAHGLRLPDADIAHAGTSPLRRDRFSMQEREPRT
eukprot:1223268-Rhodomonas_salina.2